MIEIDSRGRKCPQPIIDLAQGLLRNPEEVEFCLLSDDVATWSDLTAWSRMTGHQVTTSGPTTFLISRLRN
jgi:tRNA 2-thiouridine synthesizing protein A